MCVQPRIVPASRHQPWTKNSSYHAPDATSQGNEWRQDCQATLDQWNPLITWSLEHRMLEAKAFISLCLPTYYSLTEVPHVWMGGGCQERLPLESLPGSQACLIFHQSWLRAWIISDWAVLCRACSSETPETIYILIQHRARELLQVLTEQKIERKRIIQSYSLIQNAKVW